MKFSPIRARNSFFPWLQMEFRKARTDDCFPCPTGRKASTGFFTKGPLSLGGKGVLSVILYVRRGLPFPQLK